MLSLEAFSLELFLPGKNLHQSFHPRAAFGRRLKFALHLSDAPNASEILFAANPTIRFRRKCGAAMPFTLIIS
jgi:hypothetical protein